MSHISEVDLEVTDLSALEAACKRLGLELVRGQKSYKWFGRSVGDAPLPKGMKVEDLGRCDHAIKIPGNTEAYEIGVVKKKSGGYLLAWDSWNKGRGMQNVAGEDCEDLAQAYGVVVAKRQAAKEGWQVQEQLLANGTIKLIAN